MKDSVSIFCKIWQGIFFRFPDCVLLPHWCACNTGCDFPTHCTFPSRCQCSQKQRSFYLVITVSSASSILCFLSLIGTLSLVVLCHSVVNCLDFSQVTWHSFLPLSLHRLHVQSPGLSTQCSFLPNNTADSESKHVRACKGPNLFPSSLHFGKVLPDAILPLTMIRHSPI
jgi:hypothetical protein